MKGIRKLFLGLILLTLFGVGFKVEAKAAPALSLTIDENVGGDKIKVLFSGSTDAGSDTTVFPFTTGTDTFIYNYNIKSGSTNILTTPLQLRLKNAAGTYSYSKDGGANWTPVTGTLTDVIVAEVEKTNLNNYITGDGDTKTGTFSVVLTGSSTDPDPKTATNSPASTVAENSKTINKYKFSATAKYDAGDFPSGSTTPVITVSKEYAFEGDSVTATVTTDPGYGYTISEWKDGMTSKAAATTQTFTMTNAAKAVQCIYTKNTGAVTISDLNNKYFLQGVTSNAKTVNLTGYTSANISEVWIDGHKLDATDVSISAGPPCTIKFKVPSTTGTDKTFALKMSDGQVYDSYKINIVAEPTITVPASYSVGVGDTVTITPTCSVTPTSVGFRGETGSSTYFSLSETTGAVTGLKVADKGYKVTATATFPAIEGYNAGAAKQLSADTTVYVETVKFKDHIYVSKDKKVKLSDFLSSGSASTNISITNNADSYIELNKTTGAANEITAKGKSSGTKEKGLKINGTDINVTVYPEPKISVETTGAGSSYKQTYTVKMPKGVYHDAKDDGWWIESVSKAKLVFKASSNSDKTREVTVDSFSDSSSSDEKLLKKATKELKTSDLNVIFRDLCKNDSDTISVIAYPYNTNKDKIDTEIASEKKEFTVYKITMDTSGGANYTVNGETVSDYFYGIDGVTYEIKSSGKTANAKLNKDTSSSEFGSGETIQYKVAGARTLKAVYGGGSNNEGGGGNMDDYDDVPKTGESKADIWILWSVLFIAILGAGFMIWKRFGLVRAIAAAEEEYAIAEEEERIETEKKEKEDKLNMLKDLRNL